MNQNKNKVYFSDVVPEKLKSMQVEFAAHIRNPKNFPAPISIEARRMKVYSELFYSSISSLLEGSFPILHEILNDQEKEKLVRDFYQPHNNRTPHFPEISREFVQYLKTEYVSEKHPFLSDFAHYEWVELAVDIDVRELNKSFGLNSQDLLDGVVEVSPLVRLHAYDYPVHQISTEHLPKDKLDEPIYLVIYRDINDEVNFLQLNQVSAFLLETLQNNKTLSSIEILESLAKQMQSANTQSIIDFGRDIIMDWYNKDIINGLKK